jgi:hypothetical protein
MLNHALFGTGTAALALLCAAPAAQNTQREVVDYLARIGVSAADAARLDAGQVVSAVYDGTTADNEIFVGAAVKILVPRAQVTSYYGQMISYVDGQVTLAFGRFGSPPAIADVKDLTFDPSEVDQLKSCRPGDCDVRLSGAGLDALRKSIDWNGADYVEQVNAFARKAVIDYVTAYQAQGDKALVTYNDRAQPVSLQDQWRGILSSSPLFHHYSPALKSYLEQFPGGSLPGGRNIFYWSKERYAGSKPIISIVHGVVYEPPGQTDRTFVAQKQLYASHYYDGSLAIATLLDAEDGGRPATYLVYANRSRGDLLKGGFGGMRRGVARTQARRGAEDTLGAIKRALESAGR